MNNLIMPSGNGATMTSREIAELTGKRHDSVIRTISTLISSSIIQQPQIVEVKNHQGQTVKECVFSGDQGKRDTLVLVARLSPEFTAAIVDRWQELESIDKPSIPQTYIQALEALVESEKQKELAIATKAEIGNRREATAMNTASQAVKRANKLEIELDQSQEWSTVKRMEIITGLKFSWRLLKSAGSDLGIESKDVFDPNFGTVKAYH
ncbi:MAG TPA: Rha family transcriptional regulator, partial [Bacillota bacterium]|nr:Rha family transcriptional regulator [Bacillota bacterium]